jgi:hypothetical protein
MQTLNRRHIVWIIVLAALVGLAAVMWLVLEPRRIQSYRLMPAEAVSATGNIMTPWSQPVHLSVGIICLDLPTWWFDRQDKGSCYVNVWLRGRFRDFRFTGDAFALRDVTSGSRPLTWTAYKAGERLDSIVPERWVDIVYEFSSPPRQLSLTLPKIAVAGRSYTIPELRFEYQERIVFGRLVNW